MMSKVSELPRRRAPLSGVELFPIVQEGATVAATISDAGPFFNVKSYGAKGNGQANDTAAIQNTIDAAHAAGGGVVFIPAGTYKCSATIVIPNDGVDVSLKGAGQRVSVLQAARDFGSGFYLVSVGDPRGAPANQLGRYSPSLGTHAYMEDLGLVGPNRSQTLGIAPCTMHGLAWGPRLKLNRVQVLYFNHGISLVGDHTSWIETRAAYNYYNVYWDHPSATNFGDMVFVKCIFEVATFAACGVNPNGSMLAVTAIGCYFGYSPYSVFKERGAGESANSVFDCLFQNCMFEWIGNAVIDENQPSDKELIGIVRDTTFQECYWSWEPSLKLASRVDAALIRAYEMTNVEIMNPKECFNFKPGSVCLFRARGEGGNRIVGDIDQVVGNLTGARKPFNVPDDALGYNPGEGWELYRPGHEGGWRAYPAMVSADITAGQIVAIDLNANGAVAPAGTNLSQPTAGVAMTTSRAGSIGIIAYELRNKWVPFSTAYRGLVKRAPSGGLAPASPTDSGLVGYITMQGNGLGRLTLYSC